MHNPLFSTHNIMEKLTAFLNYIPIELLEIIKQFAYPLCSPRFSQQLSQHVSNQQILQQIPYHRMELYFVTRNMRQPTIICPVCGNYIFVCYLNQLPYSCDITVMDERSAETMHRCVKPFTILSMLPRNFRRASPEKVMDKVIECFMKMSCCCYVERREE
jgi:hypothetical protein